MMKILASCLSVGIVVGLACAGCTSPPPARTYHIGPEAPRQPAVQAEAVAAAGAAERGAPAREPHDEPSAGVPGELALRDAFRMALEANKDIAVASLQADADRYGIPAAKGEFDPVAFAEMSRGRSDLPTAEVPIGRYEASHGSGTAGVRKRFASGADVTVSVSDDYARRHGTTTGLKPTHDTGASIALTQDLLRGFGPKVNRTDIVVAARTSRISAERLREQAIETIFQVESTYWGLHFARRDLEVRRQQVQRALKLVERAEAYVELGTSPELDITRARSSAALQRVGILQAENRVRALQHRLLQLLGVGDPEALADELKLTDAPRADAFAVTLDQALQVAWQNRPDYRQARLEVETAEARRYQAANGRLPTLQAFGEYELVGLGDDFDASTDLLEEGDRENWLIGLRFEYAIPNRTARSQYQAARIAVTRATMALRGVEERIARECADALAALDTAAGSLESALEARDLAARLLEGEERNFTLGRSTSLDVLDAQAQLASAERDVVGAQTDYATAVADVLRAEGILLQAKGIAVAEG